MKPSDLRAALAILFENNLAVLVTGPPGVGKTDVGIQATRDVSRLAMVFHPVVDDPTDYKGLPWAAIHSNNGSAPTHAEFLPYGNLYKLINAEQPTVAILDDLGQASPSVQAAVMQLLLAREVNGKRISDHITFLACTNRKEDKAGVSGILEPVKSRFSTIINLDVDLEDWCLWAALNDIPTSMIFWIKTRPEFLHKFVATTHMTNSPCPRTLAFAGRLLTLPFPEHTQQEIIRGAIGEAATVDLFTYLKYYQDLPTSDQIIQNPTHTHIPDEPAALWAVCAALARRIDVHTVAPILTYADRFSRRDYIVLLNTLAKELHKERKAKDNTIPADPPFEKTSAYARWIIDNRDLFMANSRDFTAAAARP